MQAIKIKISRGLGFFSCVSTSIIVSFEKYFIVSNNLRQDDGEVQHKQMFGKTIKLFVKSLKERSHLMNYVLTNFAFLTLT
jgi:hypothetical protein